MRDDLRYTKSHEWVRLKGNVATVGVTDFAQDQLNDIVYVELPKVGDEFEREDEFGVVESVKSVSELYAPIGGRVTEVNAELENSPELVNESPYDKGWLMRLKVDDAAEVDELLTPNEYLALIEEKEEESEEEEELGEEMEME